MDRDTLDRIFDPYFTTKEKAKGTGLGLAVVHGIITNLDGKIFVQSDPGAGTKVDVFMPCLEEELHVADAPPERGVETGTERILLVDDEKQITRMVTLMLTRLGYEAVAYNSSVAALEDFKDNSGQYDLVIIDLTMPSLTGERLSEAIKAVAPDMPVILCTGYNEKMDEDTAQAHGIDLVLAKPVAKEKLAKAIRSVLDA
jgi:CheY-like chemotaxis protein